MGKFNLNLNGIYHGEMTEVADQSGYVVITSKLRFMLKDISLFAKVNSLTDKVYRTPSR